MISHAVFSFTNSYELWTPLVAQDPISGQNKTTYVFAKAGKGVIVPGSQGSVYLSTSESLPRRAALREVKDKNGVNLFTVSGEPYDMYIIEVSPQYDAFGSVVGWKHLLKPVMKKTSDDLFNYATAGIDSAVAGV